MLGTQVVVLKKGSLIIENLYFWSHHFLNSFISSASFSLEFQKFFSITRTFFLTVGQNNFGNKIPLTVEKNDAANGEVEKDSRPLRRIDHGQNNRHNKNQNFNKQCPNNSASQISPINKIKLSNELTFLNLLNYSFFLQQGAERGNCGNYLST